MYFTSTISITLVLFLVGIVSSLFLLSNELGIYVKEKVSMSIVLNDSIETQEVNRIKEILTIAPFTKSVTYISKEEALESHIQSLGENPVDFLGYNPLLASLEVQLNAEYAELDSIAKIEAKLKPYQGIKRIIYQKDMIDAINNNITTISWILIIIAAVLLLLSVILINNTIRLSVYSKRFLINTMKLVGATPWIIRAPFVRKYVGIGLIASILTLGGLAGVGYYAQYLTGMTMILMNYKLIITVAAIVICTGILITFCSSYLAVGKYIRMKTNDLYYI